MNRRELLKLLGMGVIGYSLDIDKLLWVPGQKTIFLPPINQGISLSEIINIEFERILPQIQTVFERSDYFYTILDKEQK